MICSVLLVFRPGLPSRATVRTLPSESTLLTPLTGATSDSWAVLFTQSATFTLSREGSSREPSLFVRNSTHLTLSSWVAR